MRTALYPQTPDGFVPAAASNGNGYRGRAEGEARKQKWHTPLRESRVAYIRRGQRALLARLLEGDAATADDVRKVVELPPGMDPRCLGAVPGSLARLGIIRSLGYAKSARPERHASLIQIWTLVDRDAAARWQWLNPDYPDLAIAEDLPLFSAAHQKSPTVTADGQVTDDPQHIQNGDTSNGKAI